MILQSDSDTACTDAGSLKAVQLSTVIVGHCAGLALRLFCGRKVIEVLTNCSLASITKPILRYIPSPLH